MGPRWNRIRQGEPLRFLPREVGCIYRMTGPPISLCWMVEWGLPLSILGYSGLMHDKVQSFGCLPTMGLAQSRILIGGHQRHCDMLYEMDVSRRRADDGPRLAICKLHVASGLAASWIPGHRHVLHESRIVGNGSCLTQAPSTFIFKTRITVSASQRARGLWRHAFSRCGPLSEARKSAPLASVA